MDKVLRHGSLFSGIGGFDLAAEWMGWENVFHCEIGEFNQKILKYYWPQAISYADIKQTDFTIHRGSIDILTGGFPCQPYSLAGKRKGKEDERHLWPEMLRAIREIKPKWIVGENVPGIINWSGGLVFEEVQTDLEAEGYEVQPIVLPAASVNAPHRRDRVWFIAYSNSDGHESGRLKQSGFKETESKGERNQWERIWNDFRGIIKEGNVANSSIKRLEGATTTGETWNSFRPAREIKIQSWNIWPTVSPICNGDDGLSKRLDSITFPKWRNESIKSGGNAIVPQIALEIFKAINEVEQTKLF
jgi:DNA (cytosine-5)-methyltransferase 1